MKNGNVYISKYPDDFPEWHWPTGLHDACITNVETFEFPFDYSKFSGNKNRVDRNLFALQIDASDAIFDNKVTSIRLFNYRVLTPEHDLRGRKQIWWLADRLISKDGQYILEIDLQDFASFPEDFTFRILFTRAEVDRHK